MTYRRTLLRCSGFSVVEGLALGATVVLLAALLLPGLAQGGNPFARAREIARRSSCRSNLKQIGLAVLQYSQDNDEKYPIIASSNTTASMPVYYSSYGWADDVLPYLKNVRIYQCPAEVNGQGDSAAKVGFTDYYYNSNLNTPLHGRPGRRGKRGAAVHLTGVETNNLTNPTKTVLAGEGMNGDARYHRTSTEADPHANSGKPNHSAPNRMHDGTANYLMADGHVVGLTPDLVYGGAQPGRDKQPGSPANLGHYTATHLIK